MRRWVRAGAVVAAALGLSAMRGSGEPQTWPAPGPAALPAKGGPEPEDAALTALVRGLPVCVVAGSWSAGELGRSALFRARRQGRTLTVGYFFHWSTERPWGRNVLSYTLLPALLIDAFYTHLFFVMPGAQRIIYGPGDVEGALVVYRQGDDGRWAAAAGTADDATHDEIALPAQDLVDRQGRVVLMTDVWSHQLGAPGAARFADADGATPTCYAGDALLPLSPETTRAFRLGSPADPRRAPPAWRFPADAVL